VGTSFEEGGDMMRGRWEEIARKVGLRRSLEGNGKKLR
jgi:hypothetical protein